MLKKAKFYPNSPEGFDEKSSIFIQTCHEGSWCTFRGPPVYFFPMPEHPCSTGSLGTRLSMRLRYPVPNDQGRTVQDQSMITLINKK